MPGRAGGRLRPWKSPQPNPCRLPTFVLLSRAQSLTSHESHKPHLNTYLMVTQCGTRTVAGLGPGVGMRVTFFFSSRLDDLQACKGCGRGDLI